MKLKLPISQQELKFTYCTFKEFKQILLILYDDDLTEKDMFELIFDFTSKYIKNNIIIEDDYDKLYFMFGYFIKIFDTGLDINYDCVNKKCGIDMPLNLVPVLTNTGYNDIINIEYKNVNHKLTGISYIEPVLSLGLDTYTSLNKTMLMKDYNLLKSKIELAIQRLLLKPKMNYVIDFTCNFCKTHNHKEYKYRTFVDLISYIKQNYNVELYYNNILLMKRFGYSVNELNCMLLSEVDYLCTYEKVLSDKKNK